MSTPQFARTPMAQVDCSPAERIRRARSVVQSSDAVEAHAFAQGLQAFIHVFPTWYMSKFQAMFAPRRNAFGEFAGPSAGSTKRWANVLAHNRRPLTVETDKGRGGGPNIDLLYSSAWLDLS